LRMVEFASGCGSSAPQARHRPSGVETPSGGATTTLRRPKAIRASCRAETRKPARRRVDRLSRGDVSRGSPRTAARGRIGSEPRCCPPQIVNLAGQSAKRTRGKSMQRPLVQRGLDGAQRGRDRKQVAGQGGQHARKAQLRHGRAAKHRDAQQRGEATTEQRGGAAGVGEDEMGGAIFQRITVEGGNKIQGFARGCIRTGIATETPRRESSRCGAPAALRRARPSEARRPGQIAVERAGPGPIKCSRTPDWTADVRDHAETPG